MLSIFDALPRSLLWSLSCVGEMSLRLVISFSHTDSLLSLKSTVVLFILLSYINILMTALLNCISSPLTWPSSTRGEAKVWGREGRRKRGSTEEGFTKDAEFSVKEGNRVAHPHTIQTSYALNRSLYFISLTVKLWNSLLLCVRMSSCLRLELVMRGASRHLSDQTWLFRLLQLFSMAADTAPAFYFIVFYHF